MQAEQIEILEKAGEAFNAAQYWECHEFLEIIWKDAEHPEKTYYQGLIQTVAGLHHLQKEKFIPAHQCFNSALSKLKPLGKLGSIFDFEISNVVDFLTQVVSINKTEIKGKWKALAEKMNARVKP